MWDSPFNGTFSNLQKSNKSFSCLNYVILSGQYCMRIPFFDCAILLHYEVSPYYTPTRSPQRIKYKNWLTEDENRLTESENRLKKYKNKLTELKNRLKEYKNRLMHIISRCGHQQRDIILMNQGGEGGWQLLRDMLSTRRANSMISYYADMNSLIIWYCPDYIILLYETIML